MKKLFAIVLAMMMVLSLAACGAEEENNADLVITRAPVEETEAPAAQDEATEAPAEAEDEAAPAVIEVEFYAFEAEGVQLVPGAAFDADALPEASSVYTVPSCALEGTDNVYNYDDAFEVTAFDEGDGEFIYSVYILDPNVTTPEGLALGDSKDSVVALYGAGYQDNGNEYVYQAGDTILDIIFQGDSVASIEYRLAV